MSRWSPATITPSWLAGRRSGDVAACYADATLAGDLLGWQARRGIYATAGVLTMIGIFALKYWLSG